MMGCIFCRWDVLYKNLSKRKTQENNPWPPGKLMDPNIRNAVFYRWNSDFFLFYNDSNMNYCGTFNFEDLVYTSQTLRLTRLQSFMRIKFLMNLKQFR